MKKALIPSAFFALLLLLWQGVVLAEIWPRYLFPSPLMVAASIGEMAKDGSLWQGSLWSLLRLASGYLLAVGLGLPLGLLMARFVWAQKSFGQLALGLQTLPSICWLPLALIWFGLNEKAILFVVVAGSVLSIAMATEAGIRNVPPVWVRAARTLGAKGAGLYWKVVFPAALPAVLGGLKQGWSFAWRSLMAAELLYHTPGLGFLLNTGRELNDASRVLAVIFIIILLGTVIDRLLFEPVQTRLRAQWGLDRS